MPEPSTDATEGSLLVHVPPDTPLVNSELVEIQTVAGPAMVPADGAGLTVSVVVAAADPHDGVDIVYDIVVVPAAIAVTIPLASIVATEGAVDDHVPPAVTSDKVVLVPAHIVVVPDIAAGVTGEGLTVTVALDVVADKPE